MENIIVGVMCIVLVFVLFIFYKAQIYNKLILEVQEKTLEVLEKSVFLRIEELDGMLYAYNIMDNAFVAQGVDMDALGNAFGLRFPGKTGVVFKEEDEVTAT